MGSENNMKCQNCGHDNDPDAKFCEKCGSSIKDQSNSRINNTTIVLLITIIALVGIIGVFSGVLLMKNQQQLPVLSNSTINNTTNSGSSTNPTSSNNVQYKTYSNGVISFQYPSNWNVLPNNANTMVIVGVSSYPTFSVYNESKYGYTSLSTYVSSSKSYQTSLGYSIRSEQSISVDGFPAHEILYQEESGSGVMVVQQMELVELSPGSQYFALVGVDTVDHYDQERSTFNQIISSFKFL
jgi:predicted nucleic acid-binding Zn ribbon protein